MEAGNSFIVLLAITSWSSKVVRMSCAFNSDEMISDTSISTGESSLSALINSIASAFESFNKRSAPSICAMFAVNSVNRINSSLLLSITSNVFCIFSAVVLAVISSTDKIREVISLSCEFATSAVNTFSFFTDTCVSGRIDSSSFYNQFGIMNLYDISILVIYSFKCIRFAAFCSKYIHMFI